MLAQLAASRNDAKRKAGGRGRLHQAHAGGPEAETVWEWGDAKWDGGKSKGTSKEKGKAKDKEKQGGGKGGKKGKGKGKEKQGAAGQPLAEVVQRIVPVLANIERKAAVLDDRSSLVFICKSEEWQQDLQSMRELWTTENEKRKKKWEEDYADDWEARLEPHSMG